VPVRGCYVHTNHVLVDEHRSIEAATPMMSSHHRQCRMEELVAPSLAVDERDLMAFLSDHAGGDTAICRHDFAGISSNGAIIMEPATRSIWVVHGPPCSGRWISVPMPTVT
jgi:hypothetical protein